MLRRCPGVKKTDLAQPPWGQLGDPLCAGFPIKEDFLKLSEQLFGAKPVSLTGRQEDDLENINQWVKEATEGKIEDFLSDLPGSTVLLLLNAIHFQGALSLPLRSPALGTCGPRWAGQASFWEWHHFLLRLGLAVAGQQGGFVEQSMDGSRVLKEPVGRPWEHCSSWGRGKPGSQT